MGVKEEIRKDEANDFCKNNGIVMRTVVTFFKRGWFKTKNLLLNLDAYNINKSDVIDAIDYFADNGYIETRDADSKATVIPCDVDFDDLEIRLKAEGTLVGKHLTDDIGIAL